MVLDVELESQSYDQFTTRTIKDISRSANFAKPRIILVCSVRNTAYEIRLMAETPAPSNSRQHSIFLL